MKIKSLDHYWYSTNIISLLLLPLSGLFCFISLIRTLLYKGGLLKSYRAPVPVVIIGNISVGGTGKTPLIIELVKQLQVQGRKPGVISRGYGGQSKIWPQIINETSTADLVGDEPCLIFQRTSCPVVVGPNRQKDIEKLLQNSDCDIILSDDGMQHYALQRDVEIAVVDAQRLFGNGFCLPSGPLRESVSRLQSVDIVLFNGGGKADDKGGDKGGENNQPAFSMTVRHCQSLGKNESVDLQVFKDKTVHAVAGIGNPQRFFDMLAFHGLKVIPHAFADHQNYTQADLTFEDEYAVLMTEKDAVKCTAFDLQNLWSVPVEISLNLSAQQLINQQFDSLKSKGM